MKKIFTYFLFSFLVYLPVKSQLIDFDDLETDSVSDVDGNVYPTILFNETWWMAANLRTKHYNDGSEILQMTEYIGNDSDNDYDYWTLIDRWGYSGLDSSNFDVYGLLYSWTTPMNTVNGGVCPEGWTLTDSSDWWNLARLIVGEENLYSTTGTRNTPQGETETYTELYKAIGVGRYLKSDNGVLWDYAPAISSSCGTSGMKIVPSGKMFYTTEGFGELADYWTANYVHSDSTGQGRRYIHFEADNHNMTLSWNMNCNMQSVRCVKAAHILKIATTGITLDSTASSIDTISVTANYYWTASTNASWLSVAQSADSANGSLIITALSSNTDIASRTDTVFVTMDDAKTQAILVTQAGAEPLFSVSDTTLSILTSEAAIKTFSIASNVDWVVSSSDSWLSMDMTTGSGNAVITLSTEANTDTITRETFVTVESETIDTALIIKVIQAAAVLVLSSVEKDLTNKMLVYPNPVSNQLYLQNCGEEFYVDILSVSGKKVLSQKNTHLVDVSGLADGLYLVMITTEKGRTVRKVVKE